MTEPIHYGATAEEWLQFDFALGLTEDILPVVSNPNAPVSPQSKIKQIGKVPSRYNNQRQITGISNWTQHQATSAEVDLWSKEPDYGICLQTRNIRAFDIDIEDPDKVQAIIEHIGGHLHWLGLPCRSRTNSNKCLLAFRLAGQYPKRILKTSAGILEFLGNGQQFIAAGTHSSGVRYEWDWQNHADFPELNETEFESLWASLAAKFSTSEPQTFSLRNPPSDPSAAVEAALRDPVAQYLGELNLVTGVGREGQVFITCPFAHEHTEQIEGGSSTAYLAAETRDYDRGHFRCLHAHCADRKDEEFLDALNYRSRDFDVLPDPENFGDKIDKLSTDAEGKPIRFQPESWESFSSRPPPKWIIPGIIPQAELCVIYGASGSGKTFMALDIAFAIARGAPWRGKPTRQGRVIYICAEGIGGFRNRIKAYAHQYQLAAGSTPLSVIAGVPNFLLKDDALAVAKAIGRADIVIVDTFAQVTAGGNENSGEDMGKALAHCKGIHTATGALVILIHHAGKDETKGARGWSGIRAAADAEIEVYRLASGNGAKVTKQKDADDSESWGFKLSPIVIGEDENGHDISSCYVEYNDAAPTRGAKGEKRGYWQECILKSFDDLGGIPNMDTAIIEQAISTAPGEPHRKRAQAKRALQSLVKDDYFTCQNNLISRPL